MSENLKMENKYILITAARNEAEYIEATINSVIEQTIRPSQWIIVSDGSTDGTDEIIKKYSNKYDFIKFLRNENNSNRNFASKVFAINRAISTIKNINYDIIGILDADITFQPNYYQNVLTEFEKEPKLGIAGGEFFDIINGKKIRVIKSSSSVRGGIQLFRKECFDEIGEFTPLENGGEDIVMEVTARMNGWIVHSFDSLILFHHRHTGTEGFSIVKAKFRGGILAHTMGYSPLFQTVKSIHRFKERPYFISGILTYLGFIWAYLSSNKRKVSKEFINYLREEQSGRMKGIHINSFVS